MRISSIFTLALIAGSVSAAFGQVIKRVVSDDRFTADITVIVARSEREDLASNGQAPGATIQPNTIAFHRDRAALPQ